MWEWIGSHKLAMGWLAGFSVVTFVGSLILIPIMVVNMRADYLVNPATRREWRKDHRGLQIAYHIGKNLLGLLFLVAGIAMLVLPGQGLLTIFIGITLLDFPGKRKLELAIISQKPLLRAINWMRRRANKPPLQVNPVRNLTMEPVEPVTVSEDSKENE